MSNVAIIPARAGSQRIPRKNVREFRGKPIIAYSIEAAIDSGLFRRIYVSTDDEYAVQIARSYQCDVLLRPPALCADQVGTQVVTAHALHALSCLHQERYAYACCIYATAPLMKPLDLIGGYWSLRGSSTPYVYATDQQYVGAGQWYWGRSSAFLEGVSLDQGTVHVVPNLRVCDINTEDDWQRAEALYDVMIKGQQ